MKFILFIISLALVSISVGNQLKMLRLTVNIEKILAFMLLAAANIVLSTYILSEFSFISVPGYLIIHTFFAIASVILRFKFGKHFKPGKIEVKNNRQPSSGFDYFPKGLLIGFFSVIFFVALINLFLSLYVPPNNWDSMSYHMSRVGYWLQYGSLHHYYTHSFTQIILPPNAEILILWSVTFLKSDILANMVQWTAYCGIGLAIYLIAGILGHGRRASVFASLIYLSLPMVVLQSSSTQNDLVITFFALNFLYFLHSGLKQKNHKKLLLSGAALGLAVGTKYTIFFMLPALGAASLILLKIFKVKISLYGRWCVICLIGILMFGSYNYFQNYQTYGNPISSEQSMNLIAGEKNLEKVCLNTIRLLYDACDFRGLPEPLESYLFDLKDSFGKRCLNNPNILGKYVLLPDKKPFSLKSRRNYHEDVGWFGVLGFFLYFPAAAWFFCRVFYKLSIDERWVYAFIAVFFIIFICLMQNYSVYEGRYFILPMAFIAPLAVSFTRLKNKTIIITAAVCISLIGAITSVNASMKNRRKPLLPVKVNRKVSTNILKANFYQKRASFGNPRKIARFLKFIEEAPIPGSRIGHVFSHDDWDYPFFGRDFSRKVIPIKRSALKRGETEVMEKNELDFLIISINEEKLLNSADFVLPGNKPKKFFRIVPGHNWQVSIPYCNINIPLLRLVVGYKNRIFHSSVVRFNRVSNFGQLEGPYPEKNLPKFKWGLGPESTIFVSSDETVDRALNIDLCNFLHDRQNLNVSVNGKMAGSISLKVKKRGEFQNISIPVKLKKGSNKVILKYSKWKKKENKRKLAILFSQVRIE